MPRFDLRSLFSRNAHDVLGERREVLPGIQPVIAINKNFSATDALSSGSGRNGAFPHYVHATRIDLTGVSPILSELMDIGDIAELYSGPFTGATPLIQPAPEDIWLEFIAASAKIQADATVINRTAAIGGRFGIDASAWSAAADDFRSAATGNIAGTQYGAQNWLPNGCQVANVNGTMTTTVGASPLPLTVTASGGLLLWTGVYTSLQAGDITSLQVLARRIA